MIGDLASISFNSESFKYYRFHPKFVRFPSIETTYSSSHLPSLTYPSSHLVKAWYLMTSDRPHTV